MAEEAPSNPSRYALPASQEASVEAAFALRPESIGGYRVEHIVIESDRIRATFRGPTGDLRTLVCRHPKDDPECERHTKSFTFRGDLPEALMDAVEASLRAREGSVRWRLLEPKDDDHDHGHGQGHDGPQDLRDTELLVFLQGAKPALRRTMPDRVHAQELVARIELSNHAACLSYQEKRLGGRSWWVVYGASSSEQAERLRKLDAPLPISGKAFARDNRALGRLLGYPDCCVESFVKRDLATRDVWRRGLHPSKHYLRYLAAQQAWSERSRWELNPHLMGEGAWLVSFEPCSYRCEAALKLAHASFRILEQEDHRAARELERQLRCALAIGPEGNVVRLEYARDHEKRVERLLRAEPVAESFGHAPSRGAQELAEAVMRADLRPAPPSTRRPGAPVILDFAS